MITWRRPLAVIDFETTGIDPATSHLSEVAVIRVNNHFEEVARCHLRVKVPMSAVKSEWVRAHTEWGRAERNAWNIAAPTLASVLSEIAPLIHRAALVAQYVPFEAAWLKHLFGAWEPMSLVRIAEQTSAKEWIDGDRFLRSSIDTRELASPLKAQGLIASRSLAVVAEYFGINHAPHAAMSDAETTLKIARRLLAWRAPQPAPTGQPSPYSTAYDYDHQLGSLNHDRDTAHE